MTMTYYLSSCFANKDKLVDRFIEYLILDSGCLLKCFFI